MVPNSHWGWGATCSLVHIHRKRNGVSSLTIQYKPFSLASLSQFRTKLDQFCYQRNAIFSFWTISPAREIGFSCLICVNWRPIPGTVGSIPETTMLLRIKYKVHWYWPQPWGKQSTLGVKQIQENKDSREVSFFNLRTSSLLEFYKNYHSFKNSLKLT